MQIAVIGAGLAGLVAARILADAGHAAVVFDKSRGLGGRLATRRDAHGPFNHGSPEVMGRDPGFQSYLARASDRGAAERNGAAHRGLPGMSGLVRPLAQGLDIRPGVAVQSVDKGLTLWAGERALGQYDQVICAIPVVQARVVLADLLRNELAGVEMAPCWTLMAAFDGAAQSTSRDDMLGDPIAQPGAPGRWVVHANQDWTDANLERDADWVRDRMLAALQTRLGLGTPLVAMAHCWRYARTHRAYGAPFASLAGGRVLAGGDWALGPDADHAWQSGQAMARAVLA